MSKVVPFPTSFDPSVNRVSDSITLEQFCLLDDAAVWSDRTRTNEIIILHYPDAVAICCPTGKCAVVRYLSTDMDAYLGEALAAINA